MKIYRRLLAYAKPYGGFIIPFFSFSLIAVFFSVFQLALLIPLLNYLFEPTTQADLHQYIHAPAFSFSASYFKDIYYYEAYRLKMIKPVYVLYFMALIVI